MRAHRPSEPSFGGGRAFACSSTERGVASDARASRADLVWAKVSALEEAKCSANWMWAAKLEGEAARMYEACEAMTTFMGELGVAVDGGKDSLPTGSYPRPDQSTFGSRSC